MIDSSLFYHKIDKKNTHQIKKRPALRGAFLFDFSVLKIACRFINAQVTRHFRAA
jgi:hypothetical protein